WGGAGHPLLAPRTSQRQTGPGILAETSGGATLRSAGTARRVRGGLHRRAGAHGGRAVGTRRRRTARKPAVPSRGGEERSEVRGGARVARGRLRERRVRVGAPRARVDRRGRAP